MRIVRVSIKLVISSAVVSLLLCALSWTFYTSSRVRPHLSLTLPSGNRLDLALTRCTHNNPAFALVMYTDFTRENRFIHERMSLLSHTPVMPACP